MRILVADDDLTSRQMLKAMLTKWGFEVATVRDGHEAWQALNGADSPKLVILDWVMPGLDGLEVVRRLREIKEDEPHYIIILTSRDEKKDIAKALNAGANDYLTKPFDVDELQARLGVGVRVTRLQSALAHRVRELNKANATIAQLASTDELTRLANRRSFNDRLLKEVSGAKRHGYPLALVVADLDRFKSINDSYGHAAGDRVLESFARLLSESVRLEDLAARWGGEEFAVLLPHTHAAGAFQVAERVRSRLEQVQLPGISAMVTASFGVAELLEGESGEDLLRRADDALMRAKTQGRNRVLVAGEEEALQGMQTEDKSRKTRMGTVLLVDTDSSVLAMIPAILGTAGFRTEVVGSGSQALEMTRTLQPELILMGMQLPDTDGLSLLSRMRSQASTACTSILLLSDHDDATFKSRGLDAGATDTLTKPLIPAEVIARVKNHLQLKRFRESLLRLQGARTEALEVNQEREFGAPACPAPTEDSSNAGSSQAFLQ